MEDGSAKPEEEEEEGRRSRLKHDALRKRRRRQQQQNSSKSRVVRLENGRRQVHLTALSPFTMHGGPARDIYVYRHLYTWLAVQHLNGDESIHPLLLPAAANLIDCDIQFTLEMMDTRLEQLYAARQLAVLMGAIEQEEEEVLNEANSTNISVTDTFPLINATQLVAADATRRRQPVALIGSIRSSVSSTISTLASSFYDLPQISASSTSTELEDQESHPWFARTVPTNAGDAQALVHFLHEELHILQFAILYQADTFGTSYQTAILEADRARRGGGEILQTFPFFYEIEGSLERAVAQLAASGRRYIVCIMTGGDPLTSVLRIAMQHGILGQPGYTWLFTEGSAQLARKEFMLEADLGRAVHGSGVILLHLPRNPVFEAAVSNIQLGSAHEAEFKRHIFNGNQVLGEFNYTNHLGQFYDYLTYDAVMALGIASCACETELFTGAELYEQLLRTEFEGVSGWVSLNRETGTRKPQGLQYAIRNVLIVNSTADENGMIAMAAPVSQIVDIRNQSVTSVLPFVYADNTTIAPDAFPPLVQDYNLIPTSILAFGLFLCCSTMILSVAFLLWTFFNREKVVVRQSQPVFLCQLCIGTLLMSAAIIPLGMQEPHVSQLGLDISCMAGVWLLAIGFGLAISALFSKTWRINKLFQNAKKCRRIKVDPKDVILPCVTWMIISLALLIAWTIVAPLEWHREPLDNYDSFGRVKESVGVCVFSPYLHSAAFAIPLIAGNLLALCFANYQAYRARNISDDYSESAYIGLSTFSLLETLIIALPLLFLTHSNPRAGYLVWSLVLCISCLSILLPMFVPKINRHGNREYSAATGSVEQRNAVHTNFAAARNSWISIRTSFTRIRRKDSYEVQRGRDLQAQSKFESFYRRAFGWWLAPRRKDDVEDSKSDGAATPSGIGTIYAAHSTTTQRMEDVSAMTAFSFISFTRTAAAAARAEPPADEQMKEMETMLRKWAPAPNDSCEEEQ